MSDPDYIYDPEDWDVTYEWSMRRDLVDNLEIRHHPGEVKCLRTLVYGPDKFVTLVVLTRDTNGDPDETEIQWFDNEDAAAAAAKGAKP